MTNWTYLVSFGIYSLISRMRVLSSHKVIESAARIAILITDTYFQPNKTPTELQAMMHDGGVDPFEILATFAAKN